MNFYKAQESARKQSRRLVALFCVAVVVLILLTNTLLIAIAWFSDFGNVASINKVNLEGLSPLAATLKIADSFGWAKIAVITATISIVIIVATWSKWSSLSSGGHVVAESLGGRIVRPDSKDPRERRLLNVVEEMALAASMAVPSVFVLDNEQGVNAFAAGVSADDAVVAVSQGAMYQLNREQLQGVVAHEFSHILNGDMRMNIRILATLHGLMMINEFGRVLIHMGMGSGRRRHYFGSSSRNDKNGGAIFLIAAGAAIWVLGCAGQFFGAVIKAAVSRQREYLADASAVQFTRNPTGIAGALRVIGGYGLKSRIDNPHAYEVGHMFFCNAFHSKVFATHPPLDDRIERLMPNWSGQYLDSTADAELGDELGEELSGGLSELHASGAMGFAGTVSTDPDIDKDKPIEFEASSESGLAQGSGCSDGLDPASSADVKSVSSADGKQTKANINIQLLLQRVHNADEAQGIFFAFIDRPSVIAGDWPEVLSALNLSQKLDLLRAAIPSLKQLDKTAYAAFRQSFIDAVRSDGKRSIAEWLAYEMFRNPCDIHFGLAKAPKLKYKTLKSVKDHYQVVLTKFVQMGTQDESKYQTAVRASQDASGLELDENCYENTVSSKSFTNACYELKRAYPLLKPRIIKGLLAAAHADEDFCETEQQLIAILAAIWDLPLPAFLESENAA